MYIVSRFSSDTSLPPSYVVKSPTIAQQKPRSLNSHSNASAKYVFSKVSDSRYEFRDPGSISSLSLHSIMRIGEPCGPFETHYSLGYHTLKCVR